VHIDHTLLHTLVNSGVFFHVDPLKLKAQGNNLAGGLSQWAGLG
jgi:hypothetical protein